jgi:hypothetical protein
MKPARVTVAASVVLACLSRGTEVRAEEPEVVDVLVDVNRRLPRVWLLPADEASRGDTEALAHVLALAGLYEPVVGKVGQKESGVSVRVKVSPGKAQGQSLIEVVTSDPTSRQKRPLRRLAELITASRGSDLARVADAVVEDLTGERSHLSGGILFTDLATPGKRVVKAALATGDEERTVSPPDGFARGADFGPGGRIYYAMSRPGTPLQLFVEGRSEPWPVKIAEHIEAVAISSDGEQIALVAGSHAGTSIWKGPLLGEPQRVSTEEIAVQPSFGPGGRLVYAAGAARGPLRVVLGDKTVSPPGVWATSPSFCGRGDKEAVAYGATDGVIRVTQPQGATTPVIHGQSPVCSPDGRAVLFSREGKGAGLFIVGLAGVSPKRVHSGAGANLRWAPGRPLPPEG